MIYVMFNNDERHIKMLNSMAYFIDMKFGEC